MRKIRKEKLRGTSRKSIGSGSFWSFVLKEVTETLIKTRIGTAQ